MNLQQGVTWKHQHIKLQGLSLSGIRTAIAMPDFSISFDVAQGFPFLINLKKYFISHGHLDHAAGIPYLISQKAMNALPAGQFYMPSSLVEPLTQIMNLWESIEKHNYNYEFIPINADDEIQLNPQFFIKVFPTIHRIESFGFTLFEMHKKLKKEFLGYKKEELVFLKKTVEIHEVTHTPLVSFSGDTQIEFLDSREWIGQSKILILESTYLDSRKTIQQARAWGHTHLDEIIPRLDEIKSEKIVIIHASSRYSDHEAIEILKNRIPKKHLDRVEFFPGR